MSIPCRSLHKKLCKAGGARRTQNRTGPVCSLHTALAASPAQLCPGLSSARPVPCCPGHRSGLWRPYSLELGRHGTPVSPLAVLSALSNVGLMFWVFFIIFFLSSLDVYISKKWLNVNVRFHLQFWEESDTKLRLRELCLQCSRKIQV